MCVNVTLHQVFQKNKKIQEVKFEFFFFSLQIRLSNHVSLLSSLLFCSAYLFFASLSLFCIRNMNRGSPE